jgi:hypothetical protein
MFRTVPLHIWVMAGVKITNLITTITLGTQHQMPASVQTFVSLTVDLLATRVTLMPTVIAGIETIRSHLWKALLTTTCTRDLVGKGKLLSFSTLVTVPVTNSTQIEVTSWCEFIFLVGLQIIVVKNIRLNVEPMQSITYIKLPPLPAIIINRWIAIA